MKMNSSLPLLYYCDFTAPDGSTWPIYFVAGDLRKLLKKGERVHGLTKDKMLLGLTDRDERCVYLDASNPCFRTSGTHEMVHVAMLDAGFDAASEELVADLAQQFQIVFGSFGFKWPEVPEGFEAFRDKARRAVMK